MPEVVESKVLAVEVRSIQREVKHGDEKGKKFLAYQIFNKRTGYFEELRFNQAVTTQPKKEGNFILEVPVSGINRQGTERRKYPLTWISEVNTVSEVTSDVIIDEDDDLPF